MREASADSSAPEAAPRALAHCRLCRRIHPFFHFPPSSPPPHPHLAAALGEARIRDLNDEINKLLREKKHWEAQIKALGGPDHAATAPKMFEAEATELPNSGGYRYFGAAKDLPGVRELFAVDKGKTRRTRGEIFRGITPDYYGFRDEDDGSLLAAEAAAERQLVAQANAAFAAAQGEAGGAGSGVAASGAAAGEEAAAAGTAVLRSHVPGVLSQEEIKKVLLEKKRQLLLAKYASPELAQQQVSEAGSR